MKVRDRENRKFFTGFRDMADFFTGNRDSIPPWWAPVYDQGTFDIKANNTSILAGLAKITCFTAAS